MNYFLISTILLNMMPGPSMFYVINQTLKRNKRIILFSIAGIECGTFLHIFIFAFGFTWILLDSPLFFSSTRYMSSLLLLYLGISQWFKRADLSLSFSDTKTNYLAFWKGVMIHVFNPKIMLFFIILLPQFISANVINHLNNPLIFALIFGGFGLITHIALSYIVLMVLSKIKDVARLMSVIQIGSKIFSILFIIFGITLAINGMAFRT